MKGVVFIEYSNSNGGYKRISYVDDYNFRFDDTPIIFDDTVNQYIPGNDTNPGANINVYT